jgi:hypothetical protein
MPFVTQLKELDRGPRRFLVFTAFNVISWQCMVGAVLILFARKIDMPASWVGFLNSFLPLSMLLVVGTVPLVNWLGAKRLMFWAWLVRNLVACSVFAMPWAMHTWGPRGAWYVLLGSTLGFCVIRAFGAGGWFPWLHEVVPSTQRSVFFSTEASIAQLSTVAVSVGVGIFLHGDPSITRFLIVYAVGVLAGFISLGWMMRVPGGSGMTGDEHPEGTWAPYAIALADKQYLLFVFVVSLCFSSLAILGFVTVLYMRDGLGFSSATIMIITAMSSLGVLFTVQYWGRFAQTSGPGRAMFKSLAGHSFVAAGFLGLALYEGWSPLVVGPLIVFGAVFGAAFWTSSHRAMLDHVHDVGRVGYTNVWIVGTSIALGVTPIIAGTGIERLGDAGYQVCFAVSTCMSFLLAGACRMIVHAEKPLEQSVRELLDPALPLRVVGRIVWITVGMHHTNRAPGEEESSRERG